MPRTPKHTPTKTQHGEHNDAETARRRDEAVRRALNTPPKPHKDMKLGKSKPKSSSLSAKR
jgi:hypothetical protein